MLTQILKFRSKTGRMDVGESVQDASAISFPKIPGLDSWLSKYWIKVKDPTTILLYPKDGNMTVTTDSSQV